MVKLVSIKPSTREGKKLVATFDDGTKTHFGAVGYEDYITYNKKYDDETAEKAKRSYIARHSAQESFTNPKDASTLARYILWNKPTLTSSVADYKKRFGV